MTRLTIIDGAGNDELARCMSCNIETAGANLEHCGMCEAGWQRALRKLAAYEDSGLEPEQVVRYGEWVADEEDVLFHCSKCYTQISTSWDYDDLSWNYCPNCGVKMDKEV